MVASALHYSPRAHGVRASSHTPGRTHNDARAPGETRMNRWKVAFFVALVGWVGTFGVLGYTVIDQAVTVTYMKEGYADCEAHRDLFDAMAKGRLTKSLLQSAAPRVERELDGDKRLVQASDVEVQYDAQGRYVGSQLGSSTTPGYSYSYGD